MRHFILFHRAQSITSWPTVVSTTAVSRVTRKRAPDPERMTSPPNRVATVTPIPARPRRKSANCSISSKKKDGSKIGSSTRCTYFRRNTGKSKRMVISRHWTELLGNSEIPIIRKQYLKSFTVRLDLKFTLIVQLRS